MILPKLDRGFCNDLILYKCANVWADVISTRKLKEHIKQERQIVSV